MSDPSEPKRVRLSTAILYGAILLLTQLLITQWTVRAADNRDVIEYISFSGTLISMLLAVLAIVYSYFTTAGQKNDADRIATQIAALGTTIKTLDHSESKLADELTKLADIRSKLDDVSARVEETGQHSRNMERVLEEVRANQEATRENDRLSALNSAREEAHAVHQKIIDPIKDSAPPEENTAADVFFARRLASSSTPQQAVMLHAAYMNTINAEPTRATVNREIEPYLREGKKTSFALDTAYGEIYAYSMVYIDMSIEFSDPVNDAFKKALAARLEALSPSDFAGSLFDENLILSHLRLRASELRSS